MSEEGRAGEREAIDAHARADDLASVVRTAALSAADERRRRLSDGLAELMREASLGFEDGEVAGINVLRALEASRGLSARTRGVLARLLGRGLARRPPVGDAEHARTAEALAWIAAETGIDALGVLDAEMGAAAEPLWTALAVLVRRADQGEDEGGFAPALAAARGLGASDSDAARAARESLGASLEHPTLRALCDRGAAPSAAPPAAPDGARLLGELVPAPLGPVALVVTGLTGVLLVRHLVRLVGVALLGWRRPAELWVAASAVTLRSELRVLGRTLDQRELVIPREGLARAVREIRFPRLGLYAGLVGLAVGTYLGTSLFVDGVRAGSPSLVGIGAVVFGLGVLIDFVLSARWRDRGGRVRLLLVPRKGRAVALRTSDTAAVEAALRRLA
jgi:hypothetical protein